MSQFNDNVLIESIIDKLPSSLRDKLDNPILKEKWSDEWDAIAKEIIKELNNARDKGIISDNEWHYLNNIVFHSFGKIGSTSGSDSFRFYTGI